MQTQSITPMPKSAGPVTEASIRKTLDLDLTCPLADSDSVSAEYHLAIANQERAKHYPEMPPQTRVERPRRDDSELMAEITALAGARVYAFPQTPAETHQRDIDELFCSESAISRFHSLQLAESDAAAEIADRIAEVVCGAEGVEQIEDRRQRATCRFLANHALRLMQDHWQKAAAEAAIQKCAEWMRTEGGARFVGIPERELQAIAIHLAPKVVSAYHSISEGTAVLPPGKYLAIVKGGSR